MQQLRDAEIKQFYFAIGSNQHVRRFNIAMYDQVQMSVRDGSEYLQKEADARLNVKHPTIAVPIDRFAVHILKDEIGLPVSFPKIPKLFINSDPKRYGSC